MAEDHFFFFRHARVLPLFSEQPSGPISKKAVGRKII